MPNTRQGSIHLFRFAGIDLFLHWSWFLVAAFEVTGRTRRYSSLRWNVVEYLALFLIVTLHEFGHALACRQVGGTADRIVLWPLGGVAYVNPPARPGATLWSIAAGPLVNVALLPVLAILAIMSRSLGWAKVAPNAHALLLALLFIDLGLLIFNMLPIYPLDGGQILRSLLWFVLGRARSLKVVTIMGFLGAAGLIVLAVWLHSAWIGIVAAFMLMNCWGGLQQAQVLSRSAESPRGVGAAIKAEYKEIADSKLQSRVRTRYDREIVSLQGLGFHHLAYCLEVLAPYSAILRFPLVLVMLNKEVLTFPIPLRLAVGTVLLVHSRPASIALCQGMGVKFYTDFSDGSLLISSSYRSPLVPAPNSRIIQNLPCQTPEEAWLAHKKRSAELEAQGIAILNSGSFGDYVEIARREEGMLPEG